MISAKEAKKIAEKSQCTLRLQDAKRIMEFLDTLSERIEEKAMNGGTRLRVEFPEGLGRFYTPSQVKNILTGSLESCGFRTDDTATKSNCVFMVYWD